MKDRMASKLRRLEHHQCRSDAVEFSPFQMEDLPEEIQHLVLSLQSLKESARTSIVSRKWREVWTQYPNLQPLKHSGSIDEDSVKIRGAKFIETVNSVIRQRTDATLNKFSIRCYLQNNCSDHLDRWVHFATASKAKIIAVNLEMQRTNVVENYHFPLEALDGQDGSFLQSLFLTNVSIKPHSNLRGFEKLGKLHLHRAKITGDLPELLLNCPVLEDLELISCYGIAELNIPHPLDKLRRLLICNRRFKMVDFLVAGLTHFEYKGFAVPVALHGCSYLEKATINFTMPLSARNKGFVRAITRITGISAVRELHARSYMREDNLIWPSQVHRMTRPTCVLVNLRKLTCEITIVTKDPNSHSGILQLAHCLDFAPRLETLELHMLYLVMTRGCFCCSEGEVFPMHHRLDHLRTVYMSGFRCYLPQIELLQGIL